MSDSEDESSPLFGSASSPKSTDLLTDSNRPYQAGDDDDEDGDETGHTDLSSPSSSISPTHLQQMKFASHSMSELIRYYIPICGWFPSYNFGQQFGTDLLGGLTVSVLIIPQSIAYASMAGLPPIHGLYTAIFPMIMYFLLGMSKQMSVGPESTATILLSHVLARTVEKPDGASDQVYTQLLIEQSIRVTIITGVICLLMGFARFGFTTNILSQPILEGFIFSIAIVLITEQFPKLLGISTASLDPEAQGIEKWKFTFDHIHEAHGFTAGISVCTIAAIIGIRYFKRRHPDNRTLALFPELFFVLIFATILSAVFHFTSYGVGVLGTIDSGFDFPSMPSFTRNDITTLLSASLSIAIIGFVEAGLVSRMYAQKHDYMISANRELVAFGAANIFGGLFGAFPAFGSLTRTKIADAAGASSQFCGLCTSVIVAIVAGWFLPHISNMPRASISSMIILVAFSLIDLSALRFLFKLGDYKDAMLYCSMVFVTFLFGIDSGIMFAFTACLFMLVKQTNHCPVVLLGRTPSGDFCDLTDDVSHPQKIQGILLVKVSGSLHFANIGAFKIGLERMEKFSSHHAHPASKPNSYWQSPAASVSASGANSSSSSITPVADLVQYPAGSSAHPASPMKSPSPIAARQSIVIDLLECSKADSSAIHVFLDLLSHYHERGLLIVLVIRHQRLHDRILLADTDSLINAIFRSVSSAVEYAEAYREYGFTTVGGYESFQTRQKQQQQQQQQAAK